jgi:putative transcriptional regulator
MKVRFLADADLNKASVTEAMRREPAVEFMTAQTAGLRGMKDPEVLALAAEQQRIHVSHDVGMMPGHWKHAGRAERDEDVATPLDRGLSQKDVAMKKPIVKNTSRRSGGSRILASLREAVDWVEGKDVAVRVTTVEVPVVDVKATRKRLGLSQAAFAAKFGFQAETLRNWEQWRTYPDGAARVLLAVIAKHPEAVEDALTRSS